MSKTGLIIQREYYERVRKRSFLLVTILVPLLMICLMAVFGVIMNSSSTEHKIIEVVDASGLVSGRLENTGSITYRFSERTLDEIRADRGDIWGALVIGADVLTHPDNVQLYTWSSSTLETEAAISRAISTIIEGEKLKAYNIENLDRILADVRTRVQLKAFKVDEASGEEKESSSMLSMWLAYAFGVIMYVFVMIYGVQVMQGVIEEKNSKVLEVIVSSVKPFELMMGKIIGIACVAVTQFFIWVAMLSIGAVVVVNIFVPAEMLIAAQGMQAAGAAGMTPDMLAAAGSNYDPDIIAALGSLLDTGYIVKMLVVFIIYFIGGYLIYAAVYAALGSAVENVQDAQQFQMPVTLPIFFGLMGMISAMRDPGGALAFWLSIIPFTSPIVMVARIPYGVPAWELVLSVVLLVATFFVIVWLAGRIYRVGIFMYGKKPSFRELAKWITYR